MVQETYLGENSISNLRNVVDRISPNSIFLLTGKKSYELCGAKAIIEDILSDYKCVVFSDFEENPKLEDVARGIELIKENNCDLIISVGGGSVIDMAKLVKALENSNDYSNAIKKSVVIDSEKKLIAIPTTSGTGSEATHFAVVYIDKVKYSLAHSSILPNVTINDPIFTYSLPEYLTAIVGLDAFAQAIESLWSVNSTKESIVDSKESISLIWSSLRAAVKGDLKAKTLMSRASYLAGRAINITKTTAPHAMSYSFTSYNNLPHGHAVAMTLPFFLEYNYFVTESDCNDKRGVAQVMRIYNDLFNILEVTCIQDARSKVEAFIADIGIELKLDKLEMTVKDVAFALDNINLERLTNNPRIVSKDIKIDL